MNEHELNELHKRMTSVITDTYIPFAVYSAVNDYLGSSITADELASKICQLWISQVKNFHAAQVAQSRRPGGPVGDEMDVLAYVVDLLAYRPSVRPSAAKRTYSPIVRRPLYGPIMPLPTADELAAVHDERLARRDVRIAASKAAETAEQARLAANRKAMAAWKASRRDDCIYGPFITKVRFYARPTETPVSTPRTLTDAELGISRRESGLSRHEIAALKQARLEHYSKGSLSVDEFAAISLAAENLAADVSLSDMRNVNDGYIYDVMDPTTNIRRSSVMMNRTPFYGNSMEVKLRNGETEKVSVTRVNKQALWHIGGGVYAHGATKWTMTSGDIVILKVNGKADVNAVVRGNKTVNRLAAAEKWTAETLAYLAENAGRIHELKSANVDLLGVLLESVDRTTFTPLVSADELAKRVAAVRGKYTMIYDGKLENERKKRLARERKARSRAKKIHVVE